MLCGVGQNRIYTQHMTVHLMKSLQSIYIRCIYGCVGLAITVYTRRICTVYIWLWPTLVMCHVVNQSNACTHPGWC